jgi:hypothetical protein
VQGLDEDVASTYHLAIAEIQSCADMMYENARQNSFLLLKGYVCLEAATARGVTMEKETELRCEGKLLLANSQRKYGYPCIECVNGV